MIVRNKYTQHVVTGILAEKRVVLVNHDQPVVLPLSTEQRTANYLRQNNGREMTVAQRRQIAKQNKRRHFQ